MLSRTVEDAGTVTSPLVPWNSCGAYMAGVLGVATVAYLPFAFFNLLSPLISLIYGFTGFQHRAHHRRPTRQHRRVGDPSPQPAEGGAAMTAEPSVCRPARRRRAAPRLRAAVGLHHPLRAHRPDGHRDVDHPGRGVRARRERAAHPGHVHAGRAEPAADRDRLAARADQRPLRHRERRGRQRQRLELGRAVRGDRRRAVHPRHRRVPRRDDEDRGHPGRHRRRSSAASGAASACSSRS